jgi:hypothetical protein
MCMEQGKLRQRAITWLIVGDLANSFIQQALFYSLCYLNSNASVGKSKMFKCIIQCDSERKKRIQDLHFLGNVSPCKFIISVTNKECYLVVSLFLLLIIG